MKATLIFSEDVIASNKGLTVNGQKVEEFKQINSKTIDIEYEEPELTIKETVKQ